MAIFCVFVIINLILFGFYFKKIYKIETPWVVSDIDNSNHEILIYIFTFIIPFLSFEDDKQIVIMWILLTITYFIYIKSELIKYNILLLILWYDIVKVNLEDWRTFFLFKSTTEELDVWSLISFTKVSKKIYYLKDCKND